MRHGQGVYFYHGTEAKYKGMWVSGRKQGGGELIYADHKYVGTFKDDKPTGEGKYVFSHGTELHGQYDVKDVTQGDDDDDEEPVVVTEAVWRCGSVKVTDNTVDTSLQQTAEA
jgi:radial spoke head protein 1